MISVNATRHELKGFVNEKYKNIVTHFYFTMHVQFWSKIASGTPVPTNPEMFTTFQSLIRLISL